MKPHRGYRHLDILLRGHHHVHAGVMFSRARRLGVVQNVASTSSAVRLLIINVNNGIDILIISAIDSVKKSIGIMEDPSNSVPVRVVDGRDDPCLLRNGEPSDCLL